MLEITRTENSEAWIVFETSAFLAYEMRKFFRFSREKPRKAFGLAGLVMD
ncbi:MAG TPA: hypothetical protein PKY33_10400 [Limnohabitans sp.]|jgi:hypothetical protein|nr:hypothetical protein [Limnohabitans sp.]HQR87150.1 hypothetical protein [Limnohabitans sp.]HQS27802.1 hypothetical protein [Limnohabitans sp.]